ncbi:MAG: polysaccharide biosynthesis C-terminal domain-containing protein [Lachnospiraceae bacterium]|nr:polysaccharide biosynthesis C-terminal domain-containing protein [Lachnospiraceae bacterium]
MSVEKNLRKFILTNVCAMVGLSCYILADTFFISIAEGTKGITTLNLTMPIYNLMFAIGSMIGIGSATGYAFQKAKKSREADFYFFNSIFFTLVISVVFIILGILCPEKVLGLMGADSEIAVLGKGYLRIAMVFAPCFMLNYTFTAFVRNDFAPALAMTATFVSSFTNIVLDYLFMFPLKLGMRGAALATGMSPVISIAICSTHFLSKKNTIRFHWHRPSIISIVKSCELGIVAFVGEISTGITTTVFNFITLGLAGNVGVAAYGVITNIALVSTYIFNGVSQGLQPLASEAHGKNNKEDKKRIFRESLMIGVVLAMIIILLVEIFAEQCVCIFNSEHSEELAAYAVTGLKLYIIGFLFAAINIISAGFLSATDCAKSSSLIAIMRGLVAITGFAFLLSGFFGMRGVWLTFPVTEVFTLAITWFVLRRKKQK